MSPYSLFLSRFPCNLENLLHPSEIPNKISLNISKMSKIVGKSYHSQSHSHSVSAGDNYWNWKEEWARRDWEKGEKGKNVWPVGAQPFSCVFADPVPPGGGDCPRQPGQQCDGHCSLGQCFCRICEWNPWARGSQDLDAGVVKLFHVLSPKRAQKKMLFFLAGGQNKVCVGNRKGMGLESGQGFNSGSATSSVWLWDIHFTSLSLRIPRIIMFHSGVRKIN